MAANPLRQLPSVDTLLGAAEDIAERHGRAATVTERLQVMAFLNRGLAIGFTDGAKNQP